jgi:hypothetical protein
LILFLRIAQAVVALVAFDIVYCGESFYSFDGDGLMLFTVRALHSSFSSYQREVWA